MATHKKLICDFWYGHKMSDCNGIECYFSDIDCIYRGNFYMYCKAVGDYTAETLQIIEKAWNHMHMKTKNAIRFQKSMSYRAG